MNEDKILLWAEEERDKLIGHCWERLSVVELERRRCRHRGHVEEHVRRKP